MAAVVETMPITGMYDFVWIEEYIKKHDIDSERPILVDVGGGKGQALRQILQENPSIPASRCVLQDQPEVIEQAIRESHEGLISAKKMAASFFEPQPIKGMFENVIHLGPFPNNHEQVRWFIISAVFLTTGRMMIV